MTIFDCEHGFEVYDFSRSGDSAALHATLETFEAAVAFAERLRRRIDAEGFA